MVIDRWRLDDAATTPVRWIPVTIGDAAAGPTNHDNAITIHPHTRCHRGERSGIRRGDGARASFTGTPRVGRCRRIGWQGRRGNDYGPDRPTRRRVPSRPTLHSGSAGGGRRASASSENWILGRNHGWPSHSRGALAEGKPVQDPAKDSPPRGDNQAARREQAPSPSSATGHLCLLSAAAPAFRDPAPLL